MGKLMDEVDRAFSGLAKLQEHLKKWDAFLKSEEWAKTKQWAEEMRIALDRIEAKRIEFESLERVLKEEAK